MRDVSVCSGLNGSPTKVGYMFIWDPWMQSYLEKRVFAEEINRRSWGNIILDFSSVQISCSVVSNSLWSHEQQHARPPCPSPTPGVYPNSCPLSWWCHPTISSSVVPFSSCLQSFPTSGSFQMSQLFLDLEWGLNPITGILTKAEEYLRPKGEEIYPPATSTEVSAG